MLPAFRWRLAACSAVFVVVLTTGFAPAIAPSVNIHAENRQAITHEPFTGSLAGGDYEHTTDWGGFVDTGGVYSQISCSWRVPTVTVTLRNRRASDWVGIGGYEDADLIQAGTAEQSIRGSAKYYAWTEKLPESESPIPNFPVGPGDSISVDIVETTTNQWTIKVRNATTGRTFTRTGPYRSTHSSVDVVHEAPVIGLLQSELAITSPAVFDPCKVNGSKNLANAGDHHFIQLRQLRIGGIGTPGPFDTRLSIYATPSPLDVDGDGVTVAYGRDAPPPPG